MITLDNSLARNVNNDREAAALTGLSHELGGDELGDGLREVDAVDEDVNVEDLLERSALRGLGHVPLDNVLLLDSDLAEEVNGSRTATAESADHENLDVLETALGVLNCLTALVDHGSLVGVGLEALEDTLASVLLLGGVGEASGGSTSKASVETEGSDTALGLGVLEELEVVESALALGEATENVVPASLLLVAVGELDVGVRKGFAKCQPITTFGESDIRKDAPQHSRRLGELLQADDGDLNRGLGPRVVLNDLAANPVC